MKIAIILGTRGKPQQAAAILECAWALRSGENHFEFIVAADNDDTLTMEYPWGRLSYVPWISAGPRPVCVPEIWNRCVELTNADMIVMLPDDGFPGTLHWDAAVSLFATEGRFPRKLAAFCWQDTANPGMPTIIGASREWIELNGGEFLDPRFPFWFSDIAFAETWSFVTGEFLPTLPITLNCQPNKPNPRLRDMGFWWDFYAFTRADRLVRAEEIRAKLGSACPLNLGALVTAYEIRDAKGKAGSLHFQDATPPTPQYLEAYRRASAQMKERKAA